jgi:hypothetical protein
MTKENFKLAKALEASKSDHRIKRAKGPLPSVADNGPVPSGAPDAAGGSGAHHTEATYEELDALRGVQKEAGKSAGKAQARTIGLLNHDLEEQQKEYQHYQDTKLPVLDDSDDTAPTVPIYDTETVSNTHFNKGNHASYPHPLANSRNVQPRQLNFGARSASIPQSTRAAAVPNPPSIATQAPVIHNPSTGQYPDFALF